MLCCVSYFEESQKVMYYLLIVLFDTLIILKEKSTSICAKDYCPGELA